MPSTIYASMMVTRTVSESAVVGEYQATARPVLEDTAFTLITEDPRRVARVPRTFERLLPTVKAVLGTMQARSDGVAPPTVEIARAALRVLSLAGDSAAPPAVTRTSDGGIQLEWFSNGVGVEIEIDTDLAILVLVDENDSFRSHEANDFRDPFLLEALSHISRA